MNKLIIEQLAREFKRMIEQAMVRARKMHWDKMLKELNQIMDCKDEKEGKEKMRPFVEKWRRIYRSISNLKNKIDNYTHFLKFPNKIRSYFSTINFQYSLKKISSGMMG